MKKSYKTAVFSSIIAFFYFELGHTQEGQLSYMESFKEIWEHANEFMFPKNLCETIPHSLCTEKYSKNETRQIVSELMVENKITPQISNLPGNVLKDAKFFFEILFKKTDFSKQHESLFAKFTEPFEPTYSKLLCLYGLLKPGSRARCLKGISDIDKEKEVYGYIKTYEMELNELKENAKKIIPFPNQFIDDLTQLTSTVKSYSPCETCMNSTQDFIIKDRILSILSSSGRHKAIQNRTIFEFFWQFVSNRHPTQLNHSELQAPKPKHSPLQVIYGWKCLLDRLLKATDDQDKERQICGTITIHRKMLEEKLVRAKHFSESSNGEKALKEFMRKLTRLIEISKLYSPCDNCVKSVKESALEEIKEFC